ncbi:MAG: hypothetical protein IT429_18190 [Gemmataceae bacterium]|nr:hypothetical protein [Gemmataceae bacterium]
MAIPCGVTRALLSLVVSAGAGGVVRAQEAVRLREPYAPGYEYHVSTRVELTGSLTLPPEKAGAGAGKLGVVGKSAIEYDERVLAVDRDGRVGKTIRIYRRVDFDRTVGDQPQQSTLRPEVRRLVLLRLAQAEVPFSPDGPLSWGEIDLIRTDVFTPALAGLLPAQAVRPGETWPAGAGAVQELTDLERVEDGGVRCRLEQFTTLGGRRHARVSFTGSVRGVGEDGMSRHQLDGYFYFDLVSHHLSYLSVTGVQHLLDKEGKTVGRVEGNFVLTRRPCAPVREVADAALRGLALEPNDTNTRLLYDNPDLGIRFLHPRRWRVAGVRGRQIGLDESRGSGLMVTVEPPKQMPQTTAFLQEVQGWLRQQKAVPSAIDQPRQIQPAPQAIERFSVDVVLNKERVVLTYFVVRQALGGATIVARLLPADLANLTREAEEVARSVQITRALAP